MSNQTNLSNLLGYRKAWLVYLTLSNLPTTQGNRPKCFAVLLLALLPRFPKLTKSSTDHLQRPINADRVGPTLQHPALEGVNIACADGKVWRYFPILSAWSAGHIENGTVHAIKSNVCPKCAVLPWELGTYANSSWAWDYARYEICERVSNYCHPMFENLRFNGEKNVLHSFHKALAPGLCKPDLLQTSFHGWFKHMMDSIEGLLMKHSQLQAFDYTWKAQWHYPGLLVPKRPIAKALSGKGRSWGTWSSMFLGLSPEHHASPTAGK